MVDIQLLCTDNDKLEDSSNLWINSKFSHKRTKIKISTGSSATPTNENSNDPFSSNTQLTKKAVDEDRRFLLQVIDLFIN